MPRPDDAPAEAPAALAADLQACGIDASAAQVQTLWHYVALLARWNATYNLTAVREPGAMWVQHVLDCAAALPPLRRHLGAGAAARVADVGSGGGLPGAVWAALQPSLDVTCIDAVGKKAAFVAQAAAALALPNLHAVHARVETLDAAPFHIVASRAFASLAGFTRPTQHLLAEGECAGVWLALKGKVPHDEIAALPADVQMFHVEPLAVPRLDAERCLVWMRRNP